MCFKKDEAATPTFSNLPLQFVDQFRHLSSKILSTEIDVNIDIACQ